MSVAQKNHRALSKAALFGAGMWLAVQMPGPAPAAQTQTQTQTTDHFIAQFKRLDVSSTSGKTTQGFSSLLQDELGFIWIGSGSGLYRYDGYEFRVYEHDLANPNALHSDAITDLQSAGNGDLWVATEVGGFAHFDAANERFKHYQRVSTGPTGLSSDMVYALASEGRQLWLATDDGLNRFDVEQNRFTVFRRSSPEPGDGPHRQGERQSKNVIRHLTSDGSGGWWLATDHGLARFDHQRQAIIEVELPQPWHGTRVNRLLRDDQGRLWLATAAHGVVLGTPAEAASGAEASGAAAGLTWRTVTQIASNTLEPLPGKNISALYQDRLGAIWIGSQGQGLFRIAPAFAPAGVSGPDTLLQFRHDPLVRGSLSDDSITAVLEDRSGVLWASSRVRGLNLMPAAGAGFGHLGLALAADRGLAGIQVPGISLDSEHSVWLATLGGGLNHYDFRSGQTLHFRHDPNDPASLASDMTFSVLRDHQGALWISTLYGLSRQRADGRFEHFRHHPDDPGSLSDNNLRMLLQDSGQRLWIGTRTGGVNRYDKERSRFQRYLHDPDNPHSPSSNWVGYLYEDRARRLWLCANAGLDRYRPQTDDFERVRILENGQPIVVEGITSLLLDSGARFWLASRYGLLQTRIVETADGGAVSTVLLVERRFDISNGLPDNYIDAVLEDQNGQIWLSTDNGIARYQPALDRFTYFHVRDGALPRYFASARLLMPDGRLLFGSSEGLTWFYPQGLHANSTAPQVQLTAFSVMGKALRARAIAADSPLPKALGFAKELSLQPKQNVFAVEFAGLHYADPDRNQYRYRLQGFDADWVKADAKHRQATYTNLEPGRYWFRVQASNKDGLWNEIGAELAINVLPPWWKTWWFRLSMLLSLLALIGAGHQFRLRNIEQQKLRLQKQVVERTEQLQLAYDDLKAAQQQLVLQEKMAGLGTLTAGVAHEINNPTNFAHVAAQNLQVDLNAFEQFLTKLLDAEEAPEMLAAFTGRFAGLSDHVSTIMNGTERIKAIVKDLRSFTRQEDAEKKSVRLSDCVQSTVNLVRTKWHAQIKFRTEFIDDPELECWPALLNQVLMNLIVNGCQAIASKYPQDEASVASSEPGQLRPAQVTPLQVRPGLLSIRLQRQEDTLLIAVSDNGIGMSEQIQARILEPFYTSKSVGEGTGLGLSIAYGIVQKHGGNLTFVSTPGQGSCFSVYLPIKTVSTSSALASDTDNGINKLYERTT